MPAQDGGILARDIDLISDHLLSAHVIILLCPFSTFDFSLIKTYDPELLVDPWNVLHLMYLSQNPNSTELFRRLFYKLMLKPLPFSKGNKVFGSHSFLVQHAFT